MRHGDVAESVKRAGTSLCTCLKHSQNAGPFSVARLKMDPPFHSRLAFTAEVPALLVCRWRSMVMMVIDGDARW